MGPWLAIVPMLGLLAFVFAWPIVLAFQQSLAGSDSLQSYRALLDSSFLIVLRRTVFYALIVTLGCVILGTPIAYALVRLRGWMRGVLMLSILLPFFAGSLVRSYAWLAVLGQHGLVNSVLLHLGVVNAPLELAYTFPGLIAASIQVELPIFVLPTYSVMRQFDRKLLMAARSLGADPVTAWFTIFLPAQSLGLATSVALVFLSSLGFYVTPVLLGPPSAYLLSQELEVRINTLGDPSGASARIIVMLVIIALVLLVLARMKALANSQRRTERGAFPAALGRMLEHLARTVAPARWWFLAIPIGLLTLLSLVSQFIIVPLALSGGEYLSFPPPSLSGRWIRQYLVDPDLGDATRYSLGITVIAALGATVIGGAAALASLALPRRASSLVTLLSGIPLVVPSILIAAGLFLATLHLPVNPTIAFLLIFTALGLPLCFLVIRASAARIDPQLSRAAASLGAGPATTAWTVLVPLLVPALATGFLFAFLSGFDDISVGLFFSTSDNMPLAMKLWDRLRDSVSPLPAAVALVLSLGATSVILFMSVAFHFWRTRRSQYLRPGAILTKRISS